MTSQTAAVDTSPDQSSRVTRLYAIAEALQSAVALSMRGLLVLLLLIYLLLNPILTQSDIVASIIVAALGGLIVTLTSICAIAGYRLKRRLAPELIAPSHSEGMTAEGIFSQKINKFLLRIGPISVPPLFTLSVEPVFDYPGVSSSCHLLTGRIDPVDPAIHRIVFPHRGLWRLRGIRCVLEDRFGFSCVIWLDHSCADQTVSVHPQPVENPHLPLISSTFRAGDDISHHTQRLGEPFDIKPYQPSDGIKKILWKVFAKRGELVARHPEHAVTPEGHVIAFILARPEDDALAAWSLAYFRELEEMNLTMEAGCLGMEQRPLASSTRELDELLVQSAFEAPTKISPDLAADIRMSLSRRSNARESTQGEKIAIFLAESALTSDQAAREILGLLQALEHDGINLVVFMKRTSATAHREPTRFSRVILEPRRASQRSFSLSARNLFLKTCTASQVSVLQEPYSSEERRS